MSKTSLIYKILKAYQVELAIDTSPLKEAESDAVSKCIDYIDNGGNPDKEWVLMHHLIIQEAAKHYHKYLGEGIEDARNIGDEEQISHMNSERKTVWKLYSFIAKATTVSD